MENERELKLSEASDVSIENNNLEGDKLPFNLSPKRIGNLIEKDFAAAIERLHSYGFNDKFIWHFVQRGETPDRITIKNHLKKIDIELNARTLEILYKLVKHVFFYLIHYVRAISLISREDDEFAKKMGGRFTEIPKNFKDNRENYFLQGYVVGQARKWINDPDNMITVMRNERSRKASKAGKGKKGVITSPASKAILLALEYGFMTGKKVREFFDDNIILDEIDVDIEIIDDGLERAYRFCGVDERKDTLLNSREVDVRVSQLKKEYRKEH